MSSHLYADRTEDVEYIRIGNTTYEMVSFHSGDLSLIDLIKNSLERDAQAVLRTLDNPE